MGWGIGIVHLYLARTVRNSRLSASLPADRPLNSPPLDRPPAQLPHPELVRQLVELREQRRRQRHAVAQAVDAAVAAAVARQADAVDAGQPLRGAQIGEMAVGLGYKGRKRNEALDVDRNHEMAGIGGAVLIVVEIDDVAAERS